MEKTDFIKKVEKYIAAWRMFTVNDRVLVTVSGGADSVAMLLALHQIGCGCVAVHCNFHLRGDESNRDQKFVSDLCYRLGVKLIVRDFDVPAYCMAHKVSVEMACRELRYEWFGQVREEYGCRCIAVAHHIEDNIETLFLNLFRGTGVAGLAGIYPVNGDIVRPLLCVSRAEIEAYLAVCGQTYVTDSTNAENDAKRNKLRNIILPVIREQFPDAEKGIDTTLRNMLECNAFYSSAMVAQKARIDDDAYKFPCGSIGCKVAISEICGLAGGEAILFDILKDFNFNSAQTHQILDCWLSDSASGKRFASADYVAFFADKSLYVLKKDDFAVEMQKDDGVYPINLDSDSINNPVEIKIDVMERGIDAFSPSTDCDGRTTACFSMDLQNVGSLELRHWRKGDRFKPFGMKGSKLLSDLFTDLKFTEQQKNRTWLLVADGKIIWVLGYRSSSHFTVPTNWHHCYRLSCILSE